MSDRYAEKKDQLPSSYVAFIEKCDGWEGDLSNDPGYVVVWKKETIQERWTAYEMALNLSDHWFPFGSDGGGEMLCFDLRQKKDAVFRIPYVGMADDEALEMLESFGTLVRKIKSSSAQ